MRVLRYGSAIFVAGAGNREVARCGGGHISWQTPYFVCVPLVITGIQSDCAFFFFLLF